MPSLPLHCYYLPERCMNSHRWVCTVKSWKIIKCQIFVNHLAHILRADDDVITDQSTRVLVLRSICSVVPLHTQIQLQRTVALWRLRLHNPTEPNSFICLVRFFFRRGWVHIESTARQTLVLKVLVERNWKFGTRITCSFAKMVDSMFAVFLQTETRGTSKLSTHKYLQHQWHMEWGTKEKNMNLAENAFYEKWSHLSSFVHVGKATALATGIVTMQFLSNSTSTSPMLKRSKIETFPMNFLRRLARHNSRCDDTAARGNTHTVHTKSVEMDKKKANWNIK